MRLMECEREREVISVTRVFGWRETCDGELKEHIERCEICADVATVAALMREDFDQISRAPQLPGAAQVWWRAAVRARAEATQAAVRPLTWVHGIAAACAVGLAVAAIGLAWPIAAPAFESLHPLGGFVDLKGTVIATVVEEAYTRLPLVLTVAACVILAPVVLYFALGEDDE